MRTAARSDERWYGRKPTREQWIELAGESTVPSVVVLSDVECPACRALSPMIERARIVHSKRVRFLVRNFPLPYHPRAFAAATLIECASSEEQRWLLHNRLLERQDSLERVDFMKVAWEVGVRDTVALHMCTRGEKARQKVLRALKLAESMGLNGTPTVLLEGNYVDLQNPNSIEVAIERVLTK